MEDNKKASGAEEQGRKQNGKTGKGQVTQAFVNQGDTFEVYHK